MDFRMTKNLNLVRKKHDPRVLTPLGAELTLRLVAEILQPTYHGAGLPQSDVAHGDHVHQPWV